MTEPGTGRDRRLVVVGAAVVGVGFAVAAVLLLLGDDGGGGGDGRPAATGSTATAASDPSNSHPSTSDPSTTDPGTTEQGASDPGANGRRPLEGFVDTAFAVTSPGQPVATWCALLADSDATRGTGLMNQRDLRGYEGMVFRFPEPTTSRFYMRDTLIPLSIAFFDSAGAFVSSTDMVPCPDAVATCPTYGAGGTYLHALEAPSGGLDELGVGPGSQLSFLDGGCPG